MSEGTDTWEDRVPPKMFKIKSNMRQNTGCNISIYRLRWQSGKTVTSDIR